jgi:hypothetical protein
MASKQTTDQGPGDTSAPVILSGKFYETVVSTPAYFDAANITLAAHIDWANRAWMTNRGNAFGNAIRAAKRDHLRASTGDDKLAPTSADLEKVSLTDALAMTDNGKDGADRGPYASLQDWFSAICADFDPTATRGDGGDTIDPVEKEANDIASKEFDDFLRSKSIAPGAFKTQKLPDGSNKYKALLAQYIDRKGGMDGYKVKAQAAIEARKVAVAADDFDLDTALADLPTAQAA